MTDEKDDGGDLEASILQDSLLYDDEGEETMEDIISHLVNVLQDSSMKLESRLLRVRDEVNAFIDNHPEVRI